MTKPKPRMGRPVTVGRGRATAARAITLRLSAAEDRALTAAAGSRTAVGSYLRGAGLALPLIVDALDSAGDTLTGAWYEWEDEEGNPCSMIAHADLPYRPNNFGCPPSYAKRIRRADPDEVAAVWREIDQHDEITRLSYGGPK